MPEPFRNLHPMPDTAMTPRAPRPASRVLRLAVPALLVGLAVTCGDDAPAAPDAADAPQDVLDQARTESGLAPPMEREHEPVPANREADDFPVLATRDSGDVWVLWQHWTPEAESLRLDLLTAYGQAPLDVHTSDTRLLGTALAVDHAQRLHAVWSEQTDVGWSLRGRVLAPRLADDGWGLDEQGPVVELAGGEGRHHLWPALARDAEGTLLLTWQELHGDSMTIRARAHAGDQGWGPEFTVSTPGPSAWAPALTAVSPGRFAVVWDAAVDGDFDVLLSRVERDGAGAFAASAPRRVTADGRFQAHASVAAAGERLYVAYEVGPEQWGREGSVNKIDVALHNQRDVHIVAVEGDQVHELAHPFMDGINEALDDSVEKPEVRVDGNGNLLLAFRGLPLPDAINDPNDPDFLEIAEARGDAGKGFRESIWFSYWTLHDGTGWSSVPGRRHVGLTGSNGRSDAPIALAPLVKGGTAWAVVGDARERMKNDEADDGDTPVGVSWWKPVTKLPTHVTVGRLAKGQPVGPLPLGDARPLAPPRERREPLVPARTITTLDGRTLRLALGDLHRHTDLSRCSNNWDGPITDALRYALDVGQLDFMAVTDHLEHMNLSDWWRNVAYTDAYDVPGRFANLRAYERADALTGHRNVIARGEDLPLITYRRTYRPDRDDGEASTPRLLWDYFEGLDVLTIPHTPAGMSQSNPCVFDWLTFEPEYDRLVEIYQGYRGGSEMVHHPRSVITGNDNRFAVSGLDGGLHFGFIASSDHQSSDGAFAGAWVDRVDRDGVYDALDSRLTFASTARMALWAEWHGVPMGASARAPAGPTTGLRVQVETFDRDLERIDLVVDGRVVERRAVTGRTALELFEDEALDVPADGERYAYARVVTTDGELGWTSPVRLGSAGWTGADGLRGCEAFDRQSGKALELGHNVSSEWHGCCATGVPPVAPADASNDVTGAAPTSDGGWLQPDAR